MILKHKIGENVIIKCDVLISPHQQNYLNSRPRVWFYQWSEVTPGLKLPPATLEKTNKQKTFQEWYVNMAFLIKYK